LPNIDLQSFFTQVPDRKIAEIIPYFGTFFNKILTLEKFKLILAIFSLKNSFSAKFQQNFKVSVKISLHFQKNFSDFSMLAEKFTFSEISTNFQQFR